MTKYSKRNRYTERMYQILDKVQEERERQKSQWGFPEKNNLPEWSIILAEEFGEVMVEANEIHFHGQRQTESLKQELCQLAAVAVSMIEHIEMAEEQGIMLKDLKSEEVV
jgi:NTP pyrophosphatase (non-canonical NTP hydrolase)